MLSFDAGAMATRTPADSRLAGLGARPIDSANVVEVYSAYAGPTLSTHAGPVAVGASYRLGYVAVDDHSLAGTGFRRARRGSTAIRAAPSTAPPPASAWRRARLPFGWTVGAGYVREDMNRLDSELRGQVCPRRRRRPGLARPSPSPPASATRDIEAQPAGFRFAMPSGVPVLDARRQPDRRSDRGRACSPTTSDGLIWDAGMIWRPSPRTELQARAGHRYGGTTFTGSLSHQFNEPLGVNASRL